MQHNYTTRSTLHALRNYHIPHYQLSSTPQPSQRTLLKMKLLNLLMASGTATAYVFTYFGNCPHDNPKLYAEPPRTYAIQCQFDDAVLCGIHNCHRPHCWTAPAIHVNELHAADMRGDKAAMIKVRDEIWGHIEHTKAQHAHNELRHHNNLNESQPLDDSQSLNDSRARDEL
ncbi:hypothetical protein BU25DRAFT_202236 [Macroventuria anomochaeta]|uniref:Uncharacterized protein n=1 Tax=Macroventuria anomochaeta TaxID=301207 RepID=A0ACB6RNZ5_9PLEO|nr:uncharacterized protein BU25DRAFT_202236 [Macroventuria anomochaeta]KAF2622859.1 hypothetical protein BU25DRAFT_202236 [Macroventuria anomochaeta]